MDLCLQCLSAIPWSSDEEEQIRSFCNYEYLSSDSAADLNARLLTKREKQRKLGACLQRTLRRYLRHCKFPEPPLDGSHAPLKHSKRIESRDMFEKTFHAIATSGPNMTSSHCGVLQFALTLVKDESSSLWSSVKKAVVFREEVSSIHVLGIHVILSC